MWIGRDNFDNNEINREYNIKNTFFNLRRLNLLYIAGVEELKVISD